MKFPRIFHKSTTFILLALVFTTSAFAAEIPISQTEQEVNGKQVLTKVYCVHPDYDPELLKEAPFEQNGFLYTLTSIVKSVSTRIDSKELTQEYPVTVSVADEGDARLEALKSMPAFIDYSENGYEGKLYPVIASLTGETTGTTTHSGSKKITKTYTYDFNDDSLVPQTVDGYSLASVTWSDGSYGVDSAIPDTYTATAVYKKGYSYTTVDGWIFKLSYVGTVEKELNDSIEYTISYTGTKIPEQPSRFAQMLGARSADPANPADTGSGVSVWRILLCLLCIAAALGALAYVLRLLIWTLRNNRVEIFARDEISGEFNKMKSSYFNSRTATIIVDTLAAPSSQHFRIVLKSALAEKLKGKVITIKAGQHIRKQQVGDVSGADYVIDVNLESRNSLI